MTKKAAKTEAAKLALRHLTHVESSDGRTTRDEDTEQVIEQTAATFGAMGITDLLNKLQIVRISADQTVGPICVFLVLI